MQVRRRLPPINNASLRRREHIEKGDAHLAVIRVPGPAITGQHGPSVVVPERGTPNDEDRARHVGRHGCRWLRTTLACVAATISGGITVSNPP